MRLNTLLCAAAAVVVMAAPSAASAESTCCDKEKRACCDEVKACCRHRTEQDAIPILLAMDRPKPEPVRQTAEVWFHRPVQVGDRILLGKYVIEHDNDRMARGKPCTHIYAASDQRLPVVRFHCTHLKRSVATRNTVSLTSLSDPTGMAKLVSFQFAGENGAHGVPRVR